jgi:hypothetical protein
VASKTSARRVEAEERRAKALALRKSGLTYRQIANAIGVTEGRAWQIVTGELARLAKQSAESADQIRTLELARLDQALTRVLPILNDATDDPPEHKGRSRREMTLLAVDRLIKIMDRRAKYLGLDSAPEGDDLADRLLDRYEDALAKVYAEAEPTGDVAREASAEASG